MPTGFSEKLITRIAAHGPIPFRDFMEAALYDPEHGYYSAGRAAIGRGGDFYTSVSVGSLFGRLLARQFAEMWERLGRPERFDIVEQGAHDGQFARDTMEGLLEQSPECIAAVRYTIIEPGVGFRERQAATLARFSEKVRWFSSIDEAPTWSGVHFSNELVDAFPVHRVRWTGERWVERYVTWEEGAFRFTDGEPSNEKLRAALSEFPRNIAPGFETEVNLEAKQWIRTLAEKLELGWVLAIDYGHSAPDFFHPGRASGTLAAYRAHRRCDDPLADPGEQDLTAHVNFTALAEEGIRHGFELQGFTDQHHFMVGLSQRHFTDTEEITPEKQRELLAFRTLMHPGLLGMSFRALCLAKGAVGKGPLAGFSLARDGRTALCLD